jgi:hypothetical protein
MRKGTPNRAEQDKEMKRNELDTVALGKALSSKEVREASKALAPGEHEVDLLVRITGSLKRGEDYDQRINPKVDWTSLCAILLDGKNAKEIAEAVKLSLTDEAKEKAKAIKADAEAAMLVLKGSTLTECNGKVTTDLAVEVIEAQTAEA